MPLFPSAYLSYAILARIGSLRLSRLMIIAGTQPIAALPVIPVALTGNFTLALSLITVALAASIGANAACYAVNIGIAPDRSETAFGIMDFGFAISGFLAPTFTGWGVGVQNNFVDAFLLMAALGASPLC